VGVEFIWESKSTWTVHGVTKTTGSLRIIADIRYIRLAYIPLLSMASCPACHLPVDSIEQPFGYKCAFSDLQDAASISCVRCSFLLSCVITVTTRSSIDVKSLKSISGHNSRWDLTVASGEILHLEIFWEHGTSLTSILIVHHS
jgi:hypothetical protein